MWLVLALPVLPDSSFNKEYFSNRYIDDQMRAIVFLPLFGALTPAFLFGQLPDTVHSVFFSHFIRYNYSFAVCLFFFVFVFFCFFQFLFRGLIGNENKLIGPSTRSPPLLVSCWSILLKLYNELASSSSSLVF